jgi:RHS repeat-associated protein
MVTATQSTGSSYPTSYYTYDADGQRVKRKVSNVETWQVYGFAGELLAEYAKQGAATGPQKEYGYRNGQLLVTTELKDGNPNLQWLVTDQLGTPRLIFDKTGSLAGVKRHDYLPFGEEIFADTGGRTTTMGYTPPGNSAADGVRQKFTLKERDSETGLDFFKARYYSTLQGRFTSVDPITGVAKTPQSWNRYSYTLNNPLKYIDPDGERWAQREVAGGTEYLWLGNDDSYNAATDSKSENYEGWTAVSFDETQNFTASSSSTDEAGTTTIHALTLNTNGSATKGTYTITADDRMLSGISAQLGLDYFGPRFKAEESVRGVLSDFSDTVKSVVETLLPSSGLTPLHKLDQQTLDYFRKKSTGELLDSLKPGKPESLKVKADGTIMNGHHRLEVLLERGVDIKSLPKEIRP